MSDSKYQEAKSNIVNTLVRQIGYEAYKNLYSEDFDTLQKLVDKATPKKIDMMRYKKYDGYNIGVCKCGKTIDDEDDEINYCPKCGQAIDWSDEDGN